MDKQNFAIVVAAVVVILAGYFGDKSVGAFFDLILKTFT